MIQGRGSRISGTTGTSFPPQSGLILFWDQTYTISRRFQLEGPQFFFKQQNPFLKLIIRRRLVYKTDTGEQLKRGGRTGVPPCRVPPPCSLYPRSSP